MIKDIKNCSSPQSSNCDVCVCVHTIPFPESSIDGCCFPWQLFKVYYQSYGKSINSLNDLKKPSHCGRDPCNRKEGYTWGVTELETTLTFTYSDSE